MFEAYQVLFPLAIVLGLAGVFLWPLYFLGVIHFYPGPLHISLLLYGFLLCAISGFLMTAFPRFCRLGPVRPLTIWTMACLLALANGVSFFDQTRAAAFMALPLLFLSFFLVTKWFQRTIDPPQEFVMIPVALILGFVSVYLRSREASASTLELLARKCFIEGFVLALVMGIGNRLFPLFFGFLSAEPKSFFKLGSAAKERIWLIRAVFVFFVGSFVCELLHLSRSGLMLRCLSVMLSIFGLCHIHRCPLKSTRLTAIFRAGLGMLGLSYLFKVFFSSGSEITHILLIGSFSLLILGIATRIILSHGGYDLIVETKSKVLMILLLGSIVALVFRIVHLWLRHIPVNLSWSFAASLLGTLWCLWAAIYVPKALFPKEKVPYEKLK